MHKMRGDSEKAFDSLLAWFPDGLEGAKKGRRLPEAAGHGGQNSVK
jgi:hypothetical protein